MILVGAIAIWLIRNKRPDPSHSHKVKKTPDEAMFASVALQCAADACDAALSIKGKSLLAADAPPLPLAVCDKATCHCSYKKAADRRQIDGRRTIDVGIRPLIYDGQELREESSDRRAG